MALIIKDRVKETSASYTTGSFTLAGAVTGFQSFGAIGNANDTYYSATDVSGNWEVGFGTYTSSGTTLSRTTVLSSSAGGTTKATFSGTVNVFCTYPSGKSVNQDASGNVGIGVTPSAWQSTITALQLNTKAALWQTGGGATAISNNIYRNSAAQDIYLTTAATSSYTQNSGIHSWLISPSGTAGNPATQTTAMTLDNSGRLGIGTTSPNYKLQVGTTGSGVRQQTFISGQFGFEGAYLGSNSSNGGATLELVGHTNATDSYGWKITNDNDVATGALTFSKSAIGSTYAGLTYYEYMRIDASGNVGIGVTPSTNGNFLPTLQIKNAVLNSGVSGDRTLLAYNYNRTGGADTYISTGFATNYQQISGTHAWAVAPSGTAGNPITFTAAMTLHNSGGLSIGNTTNSGLASLNVSGSISGGYIAHAAGTTAMAFGADNVARVTPNATATYTTTVPAAGAICVLSILTSGTTSYTITFGSGFKTTGTLATGTVTARYFNITFVSDGTDLIETSRTVAIA